MPKANPEYAAEKERIAKILEPLTFTERERVKKLAVKYRKGEAKQSEIKELIDAGVIGKPAPESPSTYDSMTALAAALSIHFNGRSPILITKQNIHKWKSGRG